MLPLSHPLSLLLLVGYSSQWLCTVEYTCGTQMQEQKTQGKRKPNEPVGRLNPTAHKPFMVVNLNYYYYYVQNTKNYFPLQPKN